MIEARPCRLFFPFSGSIFDVRFMMEVTTSVEVEIIISATVETFPDLEAIIQGTIDADILTAFGNIHLNTSSALLFHSSDNRTEQSRYLFLAQMILIIYIKFVFRISI